MNYTDDFEKISETELNARLERVSLPTHGSREDKLARLRNNLNQNPDEAEKAAREDAKAKGYVDTKGEITEAASKQAQDEKAAAEKNSFGNQNVKDNLVEGSADLKANQDAFRKETDGQAKGQVFKK